MNTVTVQLNEKQYEDLMRLLDHAHSDYLSDLEHSDCEEEEGDAIKALAMHEQVVQGLISTKMYLWQAGCIDLQLEIPAEAIEEIAVPGQNEPAVSRWLAKPSYLKAQLDDLDREDCREYLTEAGIDEVEKMNDHKVRQHILWMACHDVADERTTS